MSLSLQRIGGGSVVEIPPLFSNDGTLLFVSRANGPLFRNDPVEASTTVEMHDANTGECLHLTEEPYEPIVNVQNSPYKSSNKMYACTNSGQILTMPGTKQEIAKPVRRRQIQFPVKGVLVESFNIVQFDRDIDDYSALVTWHSGESDGAPQMAIFDLNGRQQRTDILQLESGHHKVAVSIQGQNIVAVIQNWKLFVAEYWKQGKKKKLIQNPKDSIFTAVACHPEDKTVVVGNETGRIFVYYNIFENSSRHELVSHLNAVRTIAFNSSGTRFYSGGSDEVLMAWCYQRKKMQRMQKQFTGKIRHVSVSPDKQRIAVSTDDNVIFLLDENLNEIYAIQNYVRVIAEENTPWPELSLGLKVDPRSGFLVLNGPIGQLEFYSHNQKRLFTLDATNETDQPNATRLTHVAFNVKWLVTVQSSNDLEHDPKSRLKFWSFDVVQKIYVLNTQIEAPHERGVTSLEFSSPKEVENLLCASSGLDGKVKVWSLEESGTVCGTEPLHNVNGRAVNMTRKHWVCKVTTSYKDLSVNSLAFSADGSLLAVGFANTLCIYIPESLHLKAVLSAPNGQDGSTNKIIVNKSICRVSKAAKEGREQIMQMIKDYVETLDDKLLTDINVESRKLQLIDVPLSELSIEDKRNLFTEIQKSNDLNFYQKLELYQKIGINISLPNDLKSKFDQYVTDRMGVKWKEEILKIYTKKLNTETKFIGHLKLYNYLERRSDEAENGLHLKNVTFVDNEAMNNPGTANRIQSMEINDDENIVQSNPVRQVANIHKVVFATGKNSHFVIVCTERRLLIWNLLTLRLHATFKLTVRHIAVDPLTSLVAVVTFFDILYVFEPSKPYRLDELKNMPKISGIVWYPKKCQKEQSLDVDWQSKSQLLLLTEEKELVQFVDKNPMVACDIQVKCIVCFENV